jgi:hypothetical protein
MTEIEAEKHFCPFAMNRGDHGCAGQKCMAWRWTVPIPAVKIISQVLPEDRYIKTETVQTSMFPRPKGKGWEADGEPMPPTTKDNSLWTQEWKRDESFAQAERDGTCGLVRD